MKGSLVYLRILSFSSKSSSVYLKISPVYKKEFCGLFKDFSSFLGRVLSLNSGVLFRRCCVRLSVGHRLILTEI
jgi:hypothetical protein